MKWTGALCHVHAIDDLVDFLVDPKKFVLLSPSNTLLLCHKIFYLALLIFSGSKEHRAMDPHSSNGYPGHPSFQDSDIRKYTVEGAQKTHVGASASNLEKSLLEDSLEVTLHSLVSWSLEYVSVIFQKLTRCF